MKECYYPGCSSPGKTREHIPPKSFFPNSKKINLMTVKSCKLHNNEKTKDDIYVLANICLNSIHNLQNDASEVFETNVKPQLMHNNQAFLKTLLKNAKKEDTKTTSFEVDTSRLDSFFDCLTHGVLYKKTNKKVNLENYTINHLYKNLEARDENNNLVQSNAKKIWQTFFPENGDLSECIEFKCEMNKGYSTEIYSVRFLGMDFMKKVESDTFNFSITVMHKFFGYFEVVSTLTRIKKFDNLSIP